MSHPSHPYIFADIDQNHCLNGNGNHSTLPTLKKTYSRTYQHKQSTSQHFFQHFQHHSKAYFVLLVVLTIVGGVYYIEYTYQSQHGKVLTGLVHQRDSPRSYSDFPKGDNKTPLTSSKSDSSQNDNQPHNIPVHDYQKTTKQQFQTQAQTQKPEPLHQKQVQNTKENKQIKKEQLPQPVLIPSKNPSPQKPKETEAEIIERLKKRAQQTGANKRPIANINNDQRENAAAFMALKDEDLLSNSPLAQKERQYYEKKYNISQYQELPICVVIPSYNNVKDKRHIKNIRSVLMQEYSNYHIVFIDDASTDGTGDQIQQYLKKQQTIVSPERYVIIKNKQQKRAMPNLRMAAIDYCKPEDIYIIADGDDELLGKQVFKLFNAVFQKERAWFVYTNFLNIRGSIGYSRPFPAATIKNNKYRTYPFVTSHLRAFYTQLFRNIKEPDLKDDDGNYLKAANDVAICIPILQMAHERVIYVPELTYYYNSNTGQNNHQVRLKEQKGNDRMLRKRKPYQPLATLMQPVPWLQDKTPSVSAPFPETQRNLEKKQKRQ